MAVVPAPLLSDVPPRSLGLAAGAASTPEAAPAVAPTALVAHPATGPPSHLPVQETSPRPAEVPPSLSPPAVAAEPSLPGSRPPSCGTRRTCPTLRPRRTQHPLWTPQAPGSEGMQQTSPRPLLDAPGVDKGASPAPGDFLPRCLRPRRGSRVPPPPSSTNGLKTVALGPSSKCSDCLMSVLD